MRVIQTGWGNPSPTLTNFNHMNSPDFHYFGANGLSLCGRHGVGHTRELEEGRDDHINNCPVCMKKKTLINEVVLTAD